MKNILEVNNLCFSVVEKKIFGKPTEKVILHSITFNLERGKILGIAGESGSGKTTLAKILAGILKETSGSYSLNLLSNKERLRTSPIQILFQNNGDIINPLRTIDEIIEEAIKIRSGESAKEEKEIIFNSVKLHDTLGKRKGFELSGGEQQRAALARILAIRPEVLILDEPFSAQDPVSQMNLLSLFKSINEEFKITTICISHNIKILRLLCDDIIAMYKGRVVEKGITSDIFSKPQHPYTKFLLKAEDYALDHSEIQNELETLKDV